MSYIRSLEVAVRQKCEHLKCLSARERRDSGTPAGPGRDPDGTRAGPGRDPVETQAQRGAGRRPERAIRGTLRAAEAACGHSPTLEPLAGALQGTQGARKGPRVRLKAPSRGCDGGSSVCARVLAGSHPRPDLMGKGARCTDLELHRSLKTAKHRRRISSDVPNAPRSRRATPTGTIMHHTRLFLGCARRF